MGFPGPGVVKSRVDQLMHEGVAHHQLCRQDVGIDKRRPTGTDCRASADGKVVKEKMVIGCAEVKRQG